MTTCPQCGATIRENDNLSQTSGVELYRCGNCGREGGATVSVPMNIERLSGKVEVFIHWQGENPTPLEVAALRAVHPGSRDKAVKEIVSEAKGPVFFLGVLERGDAIDLQAAAKTRGLSIQFR